MNISAISFSDSFSSLSWSYCSKRSRLHTYVSAEPHRSREDGVGKPPRTSFRNVGKQAGAACGYTWP
jgi:hypothetical protein